MPEAGPEGSGTAAAAVAGAELPVRLGTSWEPHYGFWVTGIGRVDLVLVDSVEAALGTAWGALASGWRGELMPLV